MSIPVTIEDDHIVIRIPIEVLPTALEMNDIFNDLEEDEGITAEVTDVNLFAGAIVAELTDQGPMGETLVTNLMDDVIGGLLLSMDVDGLSIHAVEP